MAKLIWVLCAAVIAVVLVLVVMKQAPLMQGTKQPTVTVATNVGGPFSLIDENGKAVTDADYKGKKKLVFFGFTWCPSICPTELLRMADVLKTLGPHASDVVPLFISVDPARDTPDVMKVYTAKFDDRIIGLTGSQEQIDDVVKSFKAYAAKVPQGNGPDDYTMDHSAFWYVMDDDNHLLTLYRPEEGVQDIAADLQKRL